MSGIRRRRVGCTGRLTPAARRIAKQFGERDASASRVCDSAGFGIQTNDIGHRCHPAQAHAASPHLTDHELCFRHPPFDRRESASDYWYWVAVLKAKGDHIPCG